MGYPPVRRVAEHYGVTTSTAHAAIRRQMELYHGRTGIGLEKDKLRSKLIVLGERIKEVGRTETEGMMLVEMYRIEAAKLEMLKLKSKFR